MRGWPIGALALALMAIVLGCEREQRQFRDRTVPHLSGPVVASALRPGAAAPSRPGPYDDNAYAVAEGKRLFTWFNCVGCHAHGGGGIGPALMDAEWIYGSAPEQIAASIARGRPNGMPAFNGTIGDQQLWQLVAYVRSLAGLVRFDVASGRADHLHVRPAEQAMEQPTPQAVAPPRSR